MPAPRYVNERHENALWVCLSCLWAAAAIVAWMVATQQGTAAQATSLAESPHAWGSQLTLIALGIAAITSALRLPILSSPPRTSLGSDHAVWLLTTCASVNWLGFLALQVPTWTDLIPALLLISVSEVWFHGLVFRSGALPWLREYCAIADAAGTFGAPTSATENLGQQRYDNMPQAIDPMPLDAEQCDGIERRAVSGIDEQGRRYLSGELKISLSAQQSTETLAVGFSPPFVGEPDVDFEYEGAEEDVTVQLIHNTPSGMRLGLRRAASTDSAVFWLQWYAVEVELSQTCDASSNSRALP